VTNLCVVSVFWSGKEILVTTFCDFLRSDRKLGSRLLLASDGEELDAVDLPKALVSMLQLRLRACGIPGMKQQPMQGASERYIQVLKDELMRRRWVMLCHSRCTIDM
jgi:hypothetical protein